LPSASQATVVLEAGWRSGSLNTAGHADIDEVGGTRTPTPAPQIDEQPKPPITGPKPGDPQTQPAGTTQPKVTPITPKPGDTQIKPQPPKTAADPERDRLIQLLREAGYEPTRLDPNAGKAGAVPGRTVLLLDAINQFVVRTGAKVAVDATVKNVPVSATDISTLPGLLNGTPYKMKPLGDKTLVYKSITNNYSGEELPAALTTLSELAEVPITMDDKVAGQVNINMVDATLEQACSPFFK
jgi:hypothetical protein